MVKADGVVEDAESSTVNASTAAGMILFYLNSSTSVLSAIMAAAPFELKSIGMTARASLIVTQGTIEYLSRLLIDFNDGLCTSNVRSMECLLKILERSAAPVNAGSR